MTTETLQPETIDLEDVATFFENADLWAVVVWNDDVNTFDTVILALIEILGHSVERAQQLTWKVHNTGKAVVAIRPLDEAEWAVRSFHQRLVQASLDRA